MKVLLINDFCFGGGAEEVFRNTKAILDDNGHDVRVFYGSREAIKPKSIISYIYSFKNRNELSNVLKEFCPNVIHIHNYYHLLTSSIFSSIIRFKKRNKCKVVFTAHDYYLVSPSSHLLYYKSGNPINLPIQNSFRNQLFKTIDSRGFAFSVLKKAAWCVQHFIIKPFNHIDVIISPSKFLLEVFKENKVSVKMSCIRNPLNNEGISLNSKSVTCEKFEDVRFVYFGRLSPEKGIIDFLQLLTNSDINIHFDIIGDGPSREELDRFISENKLHNVSLLGRMPNEVLLDRIKDYDVSVIPSIGYENAPLTIPESARAGLAILGTDKGGIPEMCQVCNVPNYIYSPDNENSFKNAVSDLREQITGDLKINPNLSEFSKSNYCSLIESIYK